MILLPFQFKITYFLYLASWLPRIRSGFYIRIHRFGVIPISKMFVTHGLIIWVNSTESPSMGIIAHSFFNLVSLENIYQVKSNLEVTGNNDQISPYSYKEGNITKYLQNENIWLSINEKFTSRKAGEVIQTSRLFV